MSGPHISHAGPCLAACYDAERPPTEPTAQPTAERAGDADDVATCQAHYTDQPHACAGHPQPAAVPDHDETLRAAIEAAVRRWRCDCGGPSPEGTHEPHCQTYFRDTIEAVLGAPDGALAVHEAKVLRRMADRLAGDPYRKTSAAAIIRLTADRLAADAGSPQ